MTVNKGDLIRAGYENWHNSPPGVDPEVLADIGYAATHEQLHEVVDSTLKRQSSGHEFVAPKSLTAKPTQRPSRETPPDIPEGTIVGDWDPLR